MVSSENHLENLNIAKLSGSLVEEFRLSGASWVNRMTLSRLGPDQNDIQLTRIDELAQHASEEISDELQELLELDIDQQWTNPLSVIRKIYKYPTVYLTAEKVVFPKRDVEAQRLYPDDVYDLVPASFIEFSEGLHDAGLAWGAAKAYLHLKRYK